LTHGDWKEKVERGPCRRLSSEKEGKGGISEQQPKNGEDEEERPQVQGGAWKRGRSSGEKTEKRPKKRSKVEKSAKISNEVKDFCCFQRDKRGGKKGKTRSCL